MHFCVCTLLFVGTASEALQSLGYLCGFIPLKPFGILLRFQLTNGACYIARPVACALTLITTDLRSQKDCFFFRLKCFGFGDLAPPKWRYTVGLNIICSQIYVRLALILGSNLNDGAFNSQVQLILQNCSMTYLITNTN